MEKKAKTSEIDGKIEDVKDVFIFSHENNPFSSFLQEQVESSLPKINVMENTSESDKEVTFD